MMKIKIPQLKLHQLPFESEKVHVIEYQENEEEGRMTMMLRMIETDESKINELINHRDVKLNILMNLSVESESLNETLKIIDLIIPTHSDYFEDMTIIDAVFSL